MTGFPLLELLMLGEDAPAVRLGLSSRIALRALRRNAPALVLSLGKKSGARVSNRGARARMRPVDWFGLGLNSGRRPTISLGPTLPDLGTLRRGVLIRHLSHQATVVGEQLPGRPRVQVHLTTDTSAPRLFAESDTVVLGYGWARKHGLARTRVAISHLVVHQALLDLEGEERHTGQFAALAARVGAPVNGEARRCVMDV